MTLDKHLREVADKSKELILDLSLNLSLVTKENLADIAEKIGLMHDLGKASYFFQEYIRGGSKSNSQHSSVSAIIAYINFKKWEEYSFFAPQAYKCIQKHHSDLTAFGEEHNDSPYITLKIYESVKTSLMDDKVLNALLNQHNIQLPSLTKEKIDDLYDEIDDLPENTFGDDREKAMELFLIQNLLFSVLIDADKHSASRMIFLPVKEIYSKLNYSPSKIIAEKNQSPDKLTSLRNQFLDHIKNNPNLSDSQKLYSITAPTGSGKTFACLEFANCIQNLENKSRRVIYCLPYTSIIDQNYQEFENVLKSNLSDSLPLDYKYIVKHHHLVDYTETNNQETNYNYYQEELPKNLFFIEAWESGCVISTFVQLFHSLISDKNNMIRKLHNIINAIILLDEVQNIPPKYYCLLQVLFKVLAEKFDTYILSCTATQPHIYSPNSYIELSPSSLFDIPDFNRVRIHISPLDQNKALDIKDFCKDIINLEDAESVLIVMNTKRSAIEVYNYIKSNYSEDYQIFCLTTLHIPKHRKSIIEKVNNLLKDKKNKVILVSTQLIEAGVDLSFQKVYRDFGPLDSIIQVAGRCNRHNEYGELGGKMFVVNLKDEKHILSKLVYDKYLLQQTAEILEDYTNITSIQFDDIVKDYYKNLDIRAEGEAILRAIKDLNYDQYFKNQIPIKNFKLIENDYANNSLYLLADDTATQAKNSIIEDINSLKIIKGDKNEFFKIRDNIKQNYRILSSYEINLTSNEIKTIQDSINLEQLDDYIYFVEKENISEFYNFDSGLNIYSFETSSCLSL